MRKPITVLIAIAALALTGCHFAVGHQSLTLRAGTRVPGRSIDQPDGDRVQWNEMTPEGDGIFLFLRGEL